MMKRFFLGLVAAAARLLDKERSRRFQTPAEVAAALAPLVEAGLISADDFGGFMGMGAPPLILAMIGGTAARGNACDYIPA